MPAIVKDSANSHGFVDVRVIEQKWKDMFTYFYRFVPRMHLVTVLSLP